MFLQAAEARAPASARYTISSASRRVWQARSSSPSQPRFFKITAELSVARGYRTEQLMSKVFSTEFHAEGPCYSS
jgi:hypothetical protein